MLEHIPFNSILIDQVDEVCLRGDEVDENGEEKLVNGFLFYHAHSKSYYLLYTHKNVQAIYISRAVGDFDPQNLTERENTHIMGYRFGELEVGKATLYDVWLTNMKGYVEFVKIIRQGDDK